MLKDTIISALEAYLVNDSKTESKRRCKAGEFTYIPFCLDRFETQLKIVSGMLSASRVTDFRFVDVGCGIGTKVLVARESGFDAYGIEKSLRYVKVAKKLLEGYENKNWYPKKKDRIILGDALRADYRLYDVIYFYRPFINHEKQTALEKRIVAHAKEGAIVMANYKLVGEDFWSHKPMQRVWQNVIYRKM